MSDSDNSECSNSANVSMGMNSNILRYEYDESTNASSIILSNLNIGTNADSCDSDTSISNQTISNQAFKGSDSADGHNSIRDIDHLMSGLEGGSTSASSSPPKTTDGQKGSHKSIESSTSYTDNEVTMSSSKTGLVGDCSTATSTVSSPHKLPAHTPITNRGDLETKPTPRSSGRVRTATKRFGDTQAPKKHKNNKNINNEEGSSDEYETDKDALHKSKMLYDPHADVAGQNLFLFRTPKKKDAMANLAASTPKTPKTPTSIPSRMLNASMLSRNKSATANRLMAINNTPKHVRDKNKKDLAKIRREKSASEESDFSADEDEDYNPDDTVDTVSDHIVSDESDEQPVQSKKYVKPVNKTEKPTLTSRITRSAARKQQDFMLESDGYFSNHANKKTTTSDSTLDRLKTPRLPHDQLFMLLESMTLSESHEQAVTDMNKAYQQQFSKWKLTLNEGYSILLHGLGSKRNLLQCFHETELHHQTVLVVNGFFPSLTIKDILDNICGDILNIALSSRNFHEIVDAIDDHLSANREMHIFLIVHNIDGSMLRNNKAQLILSRLARMEQIHLIASLDHIHAPMLWDHTMLCNYQFSWWNVTTFLPYSEETAYENSMLVNNSGGLALSAMKNVILSLTSNSRETFLIIVNNQINNKGNSNFQGMPFKDLYSRCREELLVSSDVALRSQLTEFIDHNLVKMKRTPDGTEHLTIPLDYGVLQKFVEEQEDQ